MDVDSFRQPPRCLDRLSTTFRLQRRSATPASATPDRYLLSTTTHPGDALTRRQKLIYVVILGTLTALGPFTIDLYLPAFPALQDDLGVTEAAVQLTLTGTIVGFAAGQLIVGPLSDKVGRRLPLIMATSLHVIASLGAALSTEIGMLMVFRVLQGMGAAGGGVVAGPVGVERLDEPRPADGGQHGVGAELGVDVGARVGHAAERAVPRVVAGGVVQQDQAPGAEVLLVDRDVAAQRRRPRRDALRRGHLLAEDLRAQRGPTHRLHSRAELRGPSRGSIARVGLVTGHHEVRVGQRPALPMCRHAA